MKKLQKDVTTLTPNFKLDEDLGRFVPVAVVFTVDDKEFLRGIGWNPTIVRVGND